MCTWIDHALLLTAPRSVLLMNTVWANRSQVHDDPTTVSGLCDLLGVPADQADLTAFRALRQACGTSPVCSPRTRVRSRKIVTWTARWPR